jgi:hypothetical protein
LEYSLQATRGEAKRAIWVDQQAFRGLAIDAIAFHQHVRDGCVEQSADRELADVKPPFTIESLLNCIWGYFESIPDICMNHKRSYQLFI